MEPVIIVGDVALTLVEIIGAVALLLLGLWLGSFMRRGDGQTRAELMAMRGQQAELQGRLAQLSEEQAQRGDLFQKRLDERLSAMTERVGRSLSEQSEKSSEHLKRLDTRLEVIDRAQKNIESLSGEVSGLQTILSNKQARGAFGETQMQALIEQFLPPSSYTFQAALSNGKRVDALLHLPGEHLSVAVDSKFPLEAWQRMIAAEHTPDAKAARRQFGRDCAVHLKAIADKYLIHGETHEVALMYLPSEAIYMELHAHFQRVVDNGFNQRVVIVSPTTFMATLHTMRAVLKDAVMQEQAGVILKEVNALLTDTKRLDERLQKVLGQYRTLGRSLDDVEISTGKIIRRSGRMGSLELDEGDDRTTPITGGLL
ncbi:MAG: DNA recombination protein RmuC [Pseudomonadota bacterium]